MPETQVKEEDRLFIREVSSYPSVAVINIMSKATDRRKGSFEPTASEG